MNSGTKKEKTVPSVTHIILRCGICSFRFRKRIEYIGDEKLANIFCPKCKKRGHVHVFAVQTEMILV